MSAPLAWSMAERPPSPEGDGVTPAMRVALFLVPGVTALAVALRLGSVVHVAFLPLSVACGLFLLRSSVQYVRYTLWIWCFTPFVRRLADYQSGYQSKSMILLAPFCVALLCAWPLLRKVRHLFQSETLPFTLAMLGVVYGVAIGLLKVPIATVAQTTLQWIVPLFFGLYCYRIEDERGAVARELRRTLIAIALLVSVYGIYQFFIPPVWDKFWLTNVMADLMTNSFGSPEPMKVRVFSTMNSPGVLAPFLSCAILMLYRESKWTVGVVGSLAAICLLLTMARTGWFGVLVGGIYLLAKSNSKNRLRAILAIGAVLLLLPILPGASEPLQDLTSRLGSFSDMKHDDSADMRQAGLRDAIDLISKDPFGQGMGYLDSDLFQHSQIAARDQVAAHDIGLLEMGIELGYIGALLYGAALVLVVRALYLASGGADTITVALIAACITFACYVAITNPLIQFNGILLWAFVGLVLGRRRSRKDQAPAVSVNVRPEFVARRTPLAS